MSDEFIKEALKIAALDYVSLNIKRSGIEWELAEVDRERAKLSMKIVSLAALCDDVPKDIAISETLQEVSKLGLTDAVRSVLRASGDWMTARQVRDQVVKLGVNLSKYKNPLASIHTILDRLSDKEVDVALLDKKSNKFGFRWKGKVETVWDRLGALPREKADEVIAVTTEKLVRGQMSEVVRSSLARSAAKGKKASKKKSKKE